MATAVLKGTLIMGALLYIQSAAASAQSPWLSSDPVFKTITDTVSPDVIPYKDCLPDVLFVTIPRNPLSLQPEASQTYCASKSAFGLQNINTNAIKLHEQRLTGPVITQSGTTLPVGLIPNSNTVIYSFGGASFGSYRYLIKDFPKNIDTIPQPNGSIIHKIKPNTPSLGIVDAKNRQIAFGESFFSNNGKWMIADVHNVGMTRVNLETGEALTFGGAYNHGIGLRPDYIAAISGNGRYVIATDPVYDLFIVYDLSTCTPNPADITKTANCQKLQLSNDSLTAKIPGFNKIHYASFSSDHTIRMYVRYNTSSYKYMTLSPTGVTESNLEYLALGDSFASGEGTFTYSPGTDTREPKNKCHLSRLSYPYLLSGYRFFNSIESVACSGAKLNDIHAHAYTEDQAQAKGKNNPNNTAEVLLRFLPGYRPQSEFVEHTKPKYVTVSVGGNDFGFGDIIASCIAPGTCFSTPEDRLNLTYTITENFDSLVGSYQAVKQSSASDAAIYVVGYPQLAIPNGPCGLNVHLNQQEIMFSNALIEFINTTVKRAAQRAGVQYIDTSLAFTGHRLCESSSANSAVNGLTAGDDETFSVPVAGYTLKGFFTGQESYHPTKLGHELLAKTIAKATNNFSSRNPNPVTIAAPKATDSVQLTTGASGSYAPSKITWTKSMAPDVLLRRTSFSIKLAASVSQGTPAVVSLDSTRLQTTSSNTSGSTKLQATIPDSLAHGYYTLTAKTVNSAGEPVIYQKTVYLADNSDDIDGDSIINTKEQCLFVSESGVDTDRDKLDDACDPEYNKLSLVVAPLQDQNAARTPHHLKIVDAAVNGGQTLTSTRLEVSSNIAQQFRALSVSGGGAVQPVLVLGLQYDAASSPVTTQKSDTVVRNYRTIVIGLTGLGLGGLLTVYLLNRWRNRT